MTNVSVQVLKHLSMSPVTFLSLNPEAQNSVQRGVRGPGTSHRGGLHQPAPGLRSAEL